MTFEQQKDISHVMGAGEFALEAAGGAADLMVTSDDTSIYTVEADRINVRSFQVRPLKVEMNVPALYQFLISPFHLLRRHYFGTIFWDDYKFMILEV